MTRHRVEPPEVIELPSDSSEDMLSGDELEFFDAPSEGQITEDDFSNMEDIINELNARYSPAFGAADSPIDLTAIPDMDVPPEVGAKSHGSFPEGVVMVTEAACLQMVLDVLPDIAVEHALNFIQEQTTDLTRTAAQCENIIVQLLDGGAYPKESDEANNKKRKRGNEDDWEDYDRTNIPDYESDAEQLLKDEFVTVPVRHITAVLKEQKTLFKAYILLETQVRNHKHIAKAFYRGLQHARIKRGIELILVEKGSKLPKELHAARKKAEGERAKRHKAEQAQQAEKENLRQAQKNKEMGECVCCCDDVPLNRMIACNGDTTHFYCQECPKRQIETQMGQSKCRPNCFGVDDCNGTFTRKQLQQVLSDRTFERLEHMQQQQDLAAAGLDFLSECPFCDFKMECPPVKVDKEFRCQNKKCERTSCRLCDKKTHIPLTCEEAAKNGQLTLRHIVEEAMSAALIRQCNSCKHPFVKELGCNKMTCSHCSNVQCYVCSKNVTDYNHFGDINRGRCPLHDNVEDRHEQEVKKAADEAMAKVRADNPGLSDTDLMIEVSDRVKQAEDARKGQAQAHADAFPYHMVNNHLLPRAVHPPAYQAYQPPAHIPHVAQYVPHLGPVPPFFVPQPLQRLEHFEPPDYLQRPHYPPQHLQPLQPLHPLHPPQPLQRPQPHDPLQALQRLEPFPRAQVLQPFGFIPPQQYHDNVGPGPRPPPQYVCFDCLLPFHHFAHDPRTKRTIS
ncbi:hypothetical protein GQ44DRAFT_370135 [Phaeosphaeriaceae sp. PMI808]|nr:hypothetical protein GQ44DRAFT_370135 [Phaeosphaeriaceae sp. PMI808]